MVLGIKIKLSDRINLDTQLLWILANAALFYWWLEGMLSNPNLSIYVGAFALVVVAAVGNFLMGIIVVFAGASVTVLILKIPILLSFFSNESVSKIYTLLVVSIGLMAFISRHLARQVTTTKDDQIGVKFIFSLFTVLICNQLITVSKLDTPVQSLNFLKLLGEDNSAWLSGLAAGMSPDSEWKYVPENNLGGATTTGVVSVAIRGLLSFGHDDYQYTDNLLTLHRLYFIILSIGIMLVANSTFKVLVERKLNLITASAISIVSGFSVYLSFSSFIIYGHLTPIESIVFIFAAFSFLTFASNKSKSRPKLVKNLTVIIFVLLIFAAGESWYPLNPGIYAFAAVLILQKIQSINSLISKYFTYSLIIVSTVVSTFYFRQLTEIIESYYTSLSIKTHVQGGTMSPSQIYIILSIFILFSLWFTEKKLSKDSFKLYLVKMFSGAVFFYYTLIIFTSLISSPHTIDYAGAKLGLVLVTIFIPIGIILFALVNIKIFEETNFGFVYGLGIFLLLLVAGPPTSPPSPNWTQLGFPGPVTDRAKQTDQLIWGEALILKIESSPNKRILCFMHNQKLADRNDIGVCSRFAAGLQGFDKEIISEFWRQVNLNVASVGDFEIQTDADFFENYDFLVIDDILPPVSEVELHYLSETITTKYPQS
jgi:hypothetical protein